MDNIKVSKGKLVFLIENLDCFTKLSTEKNARGNYEAAIGFSNYSELSSLVKNLVHASILAIESDSSSFKSDSSDNLPVDVVSLLRLAVQLMPTEESEVLDQCHDLYRTLQREKSV